MNFPTTRLRFACAEPLKYGANAPAQYDDPNWPRFVRITDITEDGKLKDETFRSLPPDEAEPYLLQDGDLLLARSGSIGRSFLYRPEWGTVCHAGYLIRARLKRDYDAKFVFWALNSAQYWAWVEGIAIRSTIQNVSAEKYADFALPTPSLALQKRIAAFLDEKTAQIDALIAKKRQLLERLVEKRQAIITQAVTKGLNPAAPMKPSGIDWLGDIPAHWEMRPLRYAAENLNSRRVPVSAEQRKGIERLYPYYGASGIIDYVDEYIFDFPTVLVAEDGANLLSRSTPLAFAASGRYWVNNHAHILKPNDMTIWFCASLLALYPLDPHISGSAQPKLTKDSLMSLRICVPPLSEQVDIEEQVEKETALVDPIFDRCTDSVERLNEYRSALITAAVTGQIEGLQ